MAALQASHDVEIVEGVTDAQEKVQVKEIKQEIQEEEVTKTFEAETITKEEAEILERKPDKTEEQMYKLEKYRRIVSKLPGTENTPLDTIEFYRKVLVEDKAYIRNAERYWLLAHPNVSQLFEERKWESISMRLLKYPEEWIHEQRSVHSIVRALTELGVRDLITSGKEFHKDSPEIQELMKKSRDRTISLLLGKRAPGKKANPMNYLRSLLMLIGVKLKNTKRLRTSNGERIRVYKLITPNDGYWHLVQRAIGERWENYAQDTTEYLPEFVALKTEYQNGAQTQTGQ